MRGAALEDVVVKETYYRAQLASFHTGQETIRQSMFPTILAKVLLLYVPHNNVQASKSSVCSIWRLFFGEKVC